MVGTTNICGDFTLGTLYNNTNQWNIKRVNGLVYEHEHGILKCTSGNTKEVYLKGNVEIVNF